jgi:hypothetical protein
MICITSTLPIYLKDTLVMALSVLYRPISNRWKETNSPEGRIRTYYKDKEFKIPYSAAEIQAWNDSEHLRITKEALARAIAEEHTAAVIALKEAQQRNCIHNYYTYKTLGNSYVELRCSLCDKVKKVDSSD